jgi:hypothetical protein
MDFVDILLTAVLHPQRLLWSRQIEQSSDRTQSFALAHRTIMTDAVCRSTTFQAKP